MNLPPDSEQRPSQIASGPHRILAVLECCGSDEAVTTRAVALAAESGGFLTLVAVAPTPSWLINLAPYCVPRISKEELRLLAETVLARAATLVPPEIPLITAVDDGKPGDAIARRVAAAAHDLVVTRRRRLRLRPLAPPTLAAPVMAVAG
jgi:hypothetical protein